jgi:hypothetical protein
MAMPDLKLPDDVDALKAMVLAMAEKAEGLETEVADLRLCPAINESIGRDFCLAGFPSEWQGDSIFV